MLVTFMTTSCRELERWGDWRVSLGILSRCWRHPKKGGEKSSQVKHIKSEVKKIGSKPWVEPGVMTEAGGLLSLPPGREERKNYKDKSLANARVSTAYGRKGISKGVVREIGTRIWSFSFQKPKEERLTVQRASPPPSRNTVLLAATYSMPVHPTGQKGPWGQEMFLTCSLLYHLHLDQV